MLNIPSDVKALFKLDSCRKNFHVHFPNGEFSDLNNEDVAQESVQFTESVCSQNTFKFGLSESSQIEFETVGIGNMVGAKVECAIEIDCTSLGASWAAAHPVDNTLPFLDPQTVYVGSSGSGEQSYTGSLVSIADGTDGRVTSLSVPITPTQPLNGYSKPWAAGAGDNKWEPKDGTHNGVTFTVQDDWAVKLTGQTINASRPYVYQRAELPYNGISAGDTVTLWSDTYAVLICYEGSTSILSKSSAGGVAQTFTIPANATRIRMSQYGKATVPAVGEDFDTTAKYYLAKADSFSAWTPYSNICPISGLTGLSVYVSPTQDVADATTYAEDWTSTAGTVYGGTVDIVTGDLTSDMASVDLGTLNWTMLNAGFRTTLSGAKAPATTSELPKALCSDYLVVPQIQGDTDKTLFFTVGGYLYIKDTSYSDAATFKTAMDGVQLVYELATPLTYQLTPMQISLLTGQNNIWASTGAVLMAVVEKWEKKLFYRVPYGQFVVRSCPRDHKAITHRRVTAYTDTRFVDTPVQQKLMAARSVKAEYTPSFYRLLYSMSAYKNEKFLLDNNCVKTSKGAFADAYETTYQKNSIFRIGSGVSDIRYAEFSVVRATKLFSDQQVTLIPKLSKDHIYGIIGINKIKTGDLLDKIASILVNQYSIPESEAFNSAKYPMDVTVPRSMRFTTDTNLSGVTITNDFVDLSRETEFVCFSPDREDISTHIYITKSVTVKLRTDPSGDPYATFTVDDITGLGDCSLYQYDMPQGIINADFDLILTPSGTETVESGTLNIFSTAINMSDLIKGYYEASAEFSAPGRGYERRLFRLSETAVDTLLPDQYADFWMDEYNVSPIGKIKYMVMENGQQNELTYDFADGRSVYNMSGNAVFDRMNKKKSEVEAYLDTYFIPYLAAVMFDPVQITIGNGLPYLEAGDRIEATTEDNVTAKTYIMSQRISGIQHLVHEVESSGGGLLSVTEEGGMADE